MLAWGSPPTVELMLTPQGSWSNPSAARVCAEAPHVGAQPTYQSQGSSSKGAQASCARCTQLAAHKRQGASPSTVNQTRQQSVHDAPCKNQITALTGTPQRGGRVAIPHKKQDSMKTVTHALAPCCRSCTPGSHAPTCAPKQPSQQNFQASTQPSTGSRHAPPELNASTTRMQPMSRPCLKMQARWVSRLCRIAPHTHHPMHPCVPCWPPGCRCSVPDANHATGRRLRDTARRILETRGSRLGLCESRLAAQTSAAASPPPCSLARSCSCFFASSLY
jgi:hypothetical protein